MAHIKDVRRAAIGADGGETPALVRDLGSPGRRSASVTERSKAHLICNSSFPECWAVIMKEESRKNDQKKKIL